MCQKFYKHVFSSTHQSTNVYLLVGSFNYRQREIKPIGKRINKTFPRFEIKLVLVNTIKQFSKISVPQYTFLIVYLNLKKKVVDLSITVHY